VKIPKPLWLHVAVTAAVGCSDTTMSRSQDARLESGTVARVDNEIIRDREVLLVARGQGKSLHEARDALVHDALFAAASRVDTPDEASRAETSVLARSALHNLAQDARETPVSSAELANWEQARFLDVDRPPGFRVVHLVVLVDSKLPVSTLREARSHIHALRERTIEVAAEKRTTAPPARTGEDIFMERPEIPEDPLASAIREIATGTTQGELDVRYESLGVISADGRFLNYARSPWERLHESFAAAASRLERRGDVSPVVETELESDAKTLRGLHVIALLERTPPLALDASARRNLLLPEILEARSLRARKSLLERLAKERGVVIQRNADALLESVNVKSPPPR
jgi:hypothetical protein